MGWFWRVLRWSILLGLIAFAVLWPLGFAPFSGGSGDVVEDLVTITDYQVDYVVDRDGNLEAVETITADFPSDRHGLFRYWDVANQNSPHVRQPPDVTSITLDGQPAEYQMLWETGKRFRVAKIGDPDRYLTLGPHIVEIRYRIAGVLDPGGTGAGARFASTDGDPNAAASVFYWNVIPPGWNNRIERARITVSLPGPVPGAQCAVGMGRAPTAPGSTSAGTP